MTTERVQLAISPRRGDSDQAKRVIAQELADVRRSTGLPKLNSAASTAMQAAKAK